MKWRSAIRGLAEAVPPQELPDLLGELERERALALRRFLNGTGNVDGEPAPAPKTEPDVLLTVEQLAERLGVSTDYVYSNAPQWPFTKKLSPKVLRFSERGFERWLATRGK